MFDKFTKRIVSLIAASVMAVSNISSVYAVEITTELTAAASDNTDLTYQSIELYPDEQTDEKVITLDGMMPEGAEAQAVDVSEDYEGVAAYDITIRDGRKDYQPGEANPIYVEISDPVIKGLVTVWHIDDDGNREQIFGFTAEDGKVSFYATGFSVYEIVKELDFDITCDIVPVTGSTSDFDTYTVQPAGAAESFTYPAAEKQYPELYGTATKMESVDDFAASCSSGLYISSMTVNTPPVPYALFAKNYQAGKVKNADRTGIAVTPSVYSEGGHNAAQDNLNLYNAYNDGAAKFYFEHVDLSEQGDNATNLYKIYTLADDGTTKRYVGHEAKKNRLFLTNDPEHNTNSSLNYASVWEVAYTSGSGFTFRDHNNGNDSNSSWNPTKGNGSNSANGFTCYNHGDQNSYFNLWQYEPPTLTTDPYELDGHTYGLVSYKDAAKGNALLAGNYNNTGKQLGNLPVDRTVDSETNDVSYSSAYGIPGWTFEWIEGTTKYRISAVADDGAVSKYLKVDANGLCLVADVSDASEISVTPDSNNRIKLSANGYTINCNNDTNFTAAASSSTVFDLVDISGASTDALGLDGQTFGLVNKQDDAKGNALTAQADASKVNQLDNQLVKVTESGYQYAGELSGWTFHKIDTNRYTISNGTKYLKLVKDSLTLSDDPFILTVSAGSDPYEGKIEIRNTTEKYQVTRNGDTSFSSQANSNNRWLDLVALTTPPAADPLGLDGKTYGIINSKNSTGYAMMSEAHGDTKLTGKTATHVSGEQKYTAPGSPTGWTFHWDGYANYNISVIADGVTKWLKFDTAGLSLVDESAATPVTVTVGEGAYAGKISISPLLDDKISAISRNSNVFQRGTPSYTSLSTDGVYWHDLVTFSLNDPYKLDGKKYSLMHYISGATGDALIAAETNNALNMSTCVVRLEGGNTSKVLYVAKDTDITEWTFRTAGEDWYYIYAEFGNVKKYIHIENGVVSVSETPQAIQVKPDEEGKIMLSADGYSVKYQANSENPNEAGRFVAEAGSGDYLYFVAPTELDDQDLVTYKAKEVSVSDVKNGEEVIVYTRVWNGSGYDFCLIDHDGNLIPCYERGDYIMWLSKKINTAIWQFTEYYYDYTDTPNNYYDLYNPYSGMYLAPKRSTGSVLDTSPARFNMEGRRYGEYYSTILAWDQPSYSYSGLKASITGLIDGIDDSLIPSSKAKADTFYFARLVDLTNDLTEVETVDNTQHGITMKMVDFGGKKVTPDGADTSALQHSVMGNSHYNNSTAHSQTSNLLSTDLKDNGYPDAIRSNKSLAELFNTTSDVIESQYVNHLFIQSILEQSGYYEYDSCQNYATLKNALQSEDEDGKKLYLVMKDGKQVVAAYAENEIPPEGAQPIYDFFVSKEIGTHDASDKNSLKHGQFFPFDDIDMDTYAVKNGQNLYSAEDTKHQLPESDPRKYERLHLIEDPDYFFGMQLEASFTQTPNGKDNWGHDIIFEFTGDDDFWLYVDGELVIDLGGIHSALGGNVNFATGDVVVNGVPTNLRDVFYNNYISRGMSEGEAIAELKKHFDYDTSIENPTKEDFEKVFIDYSSHDMKIFYMERGAGASNLHMRFNLNYVTPGDVILTKELTGSDDLDFELVEYPVQIWYCTEELPDGTHNPTKEQLLAQDNEHINVKYQNSTRNIQYAERYTPPGCTEEYESVFFINPQQAVEIHFPEDTMFYMIRECGINTDVYESVLVNNAAAFPVPAGNSSSSMPQRMSYESSWERVENRKNVTITNQVKPDALRPLYFQKKLYDADYTPGMEGAENHKITAEQDPTTFSFRLYLSNGVTDELTLANMVKYRVISPNGKYCKWNESTLQFDESPYTNGEETEPGSLKYALKQIAENNELTAADKAAQKEALLEPITFDTSINGQISEIRAWYTVEVPNIPVGVTFEIEERDSDTERPLGYDRVQYERIQGTYYTVEGAQENVGIVRASQTPQMNVINQRGYEVQAKKIWSDVDFALGHDDIYLALFIKTVDPYTNDVTYQLAPDAVHPVRRLSAPNTDIRYFMQTLADGKALSDYEIYEVTLHGNYTVDANGYVSGYSPINFNADAVSDGAFTSVHATDRIRSNSSNGDVFGNLQILDVEHAASWSNELHFDSGVQLYGDESITAVSVPAKLRGADYLRTANASGSYNGDLCTFTASMAAEIYVALDSAVEPVPAWLNNWQMTDDTVTASDGSVLNLYRKNVAKNDTVRLGTNGGDGTVKNYIVLAAPIYSYMTEYAQGSEVHSVTINGTTYTARADKITNTRQGGIVISLYQMGTRNADQHDYGTPLPGGVFTLKKGDQRIGTYTSDENGKITILYDFIPNETYTLIQESAPGTYIALPNPVTFSVGSGDHPEITVGGNPIQWNDWHAPYVSGDQLVAYIDVYNKRFTLKAVKVDKDDNTVTLENAQFALYRSVNSVDGLIPDINPISGYETLTTDENGVIPLITESLPDGTFFLRETQSAAGYKPFLRPIRFTIRENDVVLFDDTSGGAAISTTTVEDGVSVTTVTANNGVKLIKTDGNAYECVLQIPNEKDQQSYYFDIEKIIFVDKNVHDSDTEQKFIFRVDRFAEGTTSFDDENIQASFYVTMNCDRELTYTDDDNIQYTEDDSEYHYELYHDATGTDSPKYEFIASGVKVRRTYNGTEAYTFPAAIWSGRKTVHVSSKGIYRVSEVKDWSTTDYDFWSGSNVYKGYGTPVREGQADGFVIFDVSAVKAAQFQSASTSIGGETVYRPTASFTNSETEFAYLSSQAYADNKIKR